MGNSILKWKWPPFYYSHIISLSLSPPSSLSLPPTHTHMHMNISIHVCVLNETAVSFILLFGNCDPYHVQWWLEQHLPSWCSESHAWTESPSAEPSMHVRWMGNSSMCRLGVAGFLYHGSVGVVDSQPPHSQTKSHWWTLCFHSPQECLH